MIMLDGGRQKLYKSTSGSKGYTLISLITVEVGINVEGCKSCQITKRGGWNKRGGWDFVEKTNA